MPRRHMLHWLLLLVSALLCDWSDSASAQPSGTREGCHEINVADPQAVFGCLTSFQQNREHIAGGMLECSSIQGFWAWMIVRFTVTPDMMNYRLRHDDVRPRHVPSCAVLAEAIRLMSGQAPPWADCLVASGWAGTEEHMRACLTAFVPRAYRQQVNQLKDCQEIYQRYETGLKYASAMVVPAHQNAHHGISRRNGQLPDPLPKPRPRLGPSPFDDPAVGEDWAQNVDWPMIKKKDCVVAARSIQPAGAPPPAWLSCSGYDRERMADHIAACLGTATRTGTCFERRQLYEERLRGANGGAIPSKYTPPSCEVIDAASGARPVASAAVTGVAPPSPPPAKLVPPSTAPPQTIPGAPTVSLDKVAGPQAGGSKTSPALPTPKREQPAIDEGRVALVIGNSAYRSIGALKNPANDAADFAASLTRMGWKVVTRSDASLDQMRRALLEFSVVARPATHAIVYFAGHGLESNGENYLMAIDTQVRSETDIPLENISLRSVMEIVSTSKIVGMVILDACRNSLARSHLPATSRSLSRGLAPVEPKGSMLVAYSTREGRTADDGVGRNSPFTSALLKHIETPRLDVSFVLRRVRDDVMRSTGGRQEPAVYGTLGGEEVFLLK